MEVGGWRGPHAASALTHLYDLACYVTSLHSSHWLVCFPALFGRDQLNSAYKVLVEVHDI